MKDKNELFILGIVGIAAIVAMTVILQSDRSEIIGTDSQTENYDSFGKVIQPLTNPRLIISSTPSGAFISIDGVNTNKTTPYSTEILSVGYHIVVASMIGYQSASSKVYVSGTQSLNLTLTKSAISTGVCGNRKLDVGEECDGLIFIDTSCQNYGFDYGILNCRRDCTLNMARCIINYTYNDKCGDGIVGVSEECDGNDNIRKDGIEFTLSKPTGSESPITKSTITVAGKLYKINLLGISGTKITINVNGEIKTLNASKQQIVSGLYLYVKNISANGAGVGSVTLVAKSVAISNCVDYKVNPYNFDSGTLACTNNCKINMSGCSPICGNGRIEGKEMCEGPTVVSCSKFNPNWNGIAKCNNNCTGYDTTACSSSIVCMDTDNGKNYTQSGTINSTNLGLKTDKCIDTKNLTEYYCESGYGRSIRYTCTNNDTCVDGRCIYRSCTDKCSVKETRCNTMKEIYSCGDTNADLCNELKLTPCAADNICSYNQLCHKPLTYTLDSTGKTFLKTDFDSQISCKLICDGLCYNADHIQCYNGRAQKTWYKESSVIIRDLSTEKYYEVGRDAYRTLNIRNTLNRRVVADVNVIYYPVILIENSRHSYEGEYSIFRSNFTLAAGESRNFTVKLPSDKITLSSGLFIVTTDAEINSGISNFPYSGTFAFINSSRPVATCGNYKINTPYILQSNGGISVKDKFVCHNGTFVPLGSIGCNSNEDCASGNPCVANHCKTTSPDRNSKELKLMVLSLYLTDSASVQAVMENGINYQLNMLGNEFQLIKNAYGYPKTIQIVETKCNKTSSELRTFLQNTSYRANKLAPYLLDFCGINYDYTHVMLIASIYNTSEKDKALLTSRIMNNIIAAGIYAGDGVLISEINIGVVPTRELTSSGSLEPFRLWPIMLHEYMHSLGAPDMYAENYVNGQNYLWGNCKIMNTINTFALGDPLCDFEAAYFKN